MIPKFRILLCVLVVCLVGLPGVARAGDTPDREMLKTIRPWLKRLVDTPAADGLIVLPHLAYGDLETANRLILKSGPYNKGVKGKEKWGYWNLFELLHVHMLYGDKISKPAAAHIRGAFVEALEPGRRISKASFSANGSCINHPLSCTALAMVGGEQFGLPAASAAAYRDLAKFAAVWAQMGAYREYNSPTYQAVDFVALATMRQFSRNREAAIQAGILEERLWIETGLRYHASTGTLGGPHARAYYWDTIGGASDMHYLLHRVCGPEIPLFLKVTDAHYRMDHRLSWAGRASVLTFSCPDYIRKRMLAPQSPQQLRVTSGAESQLTDLATYIGPNVSLGTCAERCAWRSQNRDFVAHWLSGKKLVSHDNIRSAFVGYHAGRGDVHKSGGDHFYHQDNGRAIALLAPRTNGKSMSLRRMNVMMFMTLQREFEEIRIGDKKIDSLPASGPSGDLIALRDGAVFVAIKPLPAEQWPVENAIGMKVSTKPSKLLAISLNNYQGRSRRFTADEIAATFHGFCIEIAEASDYSSFDEFCKQASGWRIKGATDKKGVCSVTWDGIAKPLSMQVDLPARKIVRRKIGGEVFSTAMLQAATARQDISGKIALNQASLTTAKGVPAYLYADVKERVFMGMNPSSIASRFALDTPLGALEIDKLTFGRAEITGGKPTRVNVKAVTLAGELSFASATGDAKITVNGRDVTADCTPSRQGPTHTLTYKFPSPKN
ncbi:MAG: hypothetical protein HN350_11620 [Phycisphaerales bacterium]|jgi:hypothetical protein|nr:hypothetical protein [Phycisphaerales bacterium]